MAEVVDLDYIKDMLLTVVDKQDKLFANQSNMSTRLNGIEQDVSKIKQTVIGDEKFGQKGLVAQVQDLNKYVDGDKLRNAKIVGGLGVIGILWTYFLKHFFDK